MTALIKFRGNDAAVFSYKESLWSVCGKLTVFVAKMLILKVFPSFRRHSGCFMKTKGGGRDEVILKVIEETDRKKRFLCKKKLHGESFLTTFKWK